MLVRELLEKLAKCDPEASVEVEVWESCMTDAGTDLGGYEDRDIDQVTDLEARVVLGTCPK